MEHLLKKLPFYHTDWFQFLVFLLKHFEADNCREKAGSLTYTTMLSIVPIITVLLVILSSVPALESVRGQIQQLIYSNLLPQSSIQVSQYINDFAAKSTNLTAMGIIFLFITTIMTLSTIENAFNQVWQVHESHVGIKGMMRYWTLITLGPLVLGLAFVVSGTIQSLSFLNHQVAGYAIDWAFWLGLTSFGVMTLGFVIMYWFIPNCKVPIKNATIAGVFTAVVFELLKQTFGFVMHNFTSYQAIYGAFAALPIFLLWIYLSWNIILLGVELSYTLTIFATKNSAKQHPLLTLLAMLQALFNKYQYGQTLSETELKNILGRQELPRWTTYIDHLKQTDLITQTEDDAYVLKKDLSQYTLWQLYNALPYNLPDMKQMNHAMQDNVWMQMLGTQINACDEQLQQQLGVPLDIIFGRTRETE